MSRSAASSAAVARARKFALGVADHVRGHEVDGVADRPQQDFVRQGLPVEALRELRIVAEHVEGGDHAALAQVADLRVRGERPQAVAEMFGEDAVGVEDLVVGEDVERRQRRTAGQRVAGVGVRVQEAAAGGRRRRKSA
jgi:hypothetical protein